MRECDGESMFEVILNAIYRGIYAMNIITELMRVSEHALQRLSNSSSSNAKHLRDSSKDREKDLVSYLASCVFRLQADGFPP